MNRPIADCQIMAVQGVLPRQPPVQPVTRGTFSGVMVAAESK